MTSILIPITPACLWHPAMKMIVVLLLKDADSKTVVLCRKTVGFRGKAAFRCLGVFIYIYIGVSFYNFRFSNAGTKTNFVKPPYSLFKYNAINRGMGSAVSRNGDFSSLKTENFPSN